VTDQPETQTKPETVRVQHVVSGMTGTVERLSRDFAIVRWDGFTSLSWHRPFQLVDLGDRDARRNAETR